MKDNQLMIQYHKWSKKDMKSLFQSIRNILDIKTLQFYMPYFSLYFYIHNTPLSHKIIDVKRKYYVKEITTIKNQKYYNSNLILEGKVFDSGRNTLDDKEIFCKFIPILDPIHCINNNYNLLKHNNTHTPSCYNYNTFSKINDINNSAYIDVLCSCLFSELVMAKKLPSFAIYYGEVNGIGDYKYDISEEYDDLRIDKCFSQNLGKTYTLDMFVSSSEEECEEDNDTSDEEVSQSNYNDDYIVKLEKIPLQLLFIEKLEGTLEDYLFDENFDNDVLVSCLYQISFALHYLQIYYEFTHNDLHINNVMYSSTTLKYVYYLFDDKYYRVPTFGKIFKIIDFGRSIFRYKNKVYMNDVFSKNSEAWGQYKYPSQIKFMINDSDLDGTSPNYNFDLCRLSMTILDELDQSKLKTDLYKFLRLLSTDKNGDNFCDMPDDFSLYINISKNAVNSLPKDALSNKIFKRYRVSKKHFPTKSYYKI